MAADKTHLRNLDKSYKLVPTDQKTDAGRIIYKNSETGELHSELSVTIEYPANSGKWINVPSLLNGRVYNSKGVLAMLKKGKLTPTSTHMSEKEALETAQFRSNNLSIQPASEDELVADGVERDAIGRIVEPLMANGSPNGRGNDVYMSDVSIATASNAVTDKDAINAQQAILADVALSNDFASTFPTEAENPNGLFVRAAQPEYTSGSGANANILAAAEAALASDQQTQRLAAIMDRANEEKDDSNLKNISNNINLVRSQTPRITAQENQGELDAKAANERASLERMYQIMDRANAEKEDDYFNAAQPPSSIFGDNSFNYRNSVSDMLKGKGIAGDLKAIQNNYKQLPVSAADQAMFDAASKARSLYSEGPATRQSKPEPITGTASAMDDTVDVEKGMSSNKPIFNFKYKPHMNPEEKMKDNRNLKGLSPEYGKMPGFKFVSAGTKDPDAGYWSADEDSQFWKTDAGYEKAQQTWGNTGTLPNYVKRPVKKELDVNAIKKFFGSNN